MRTVLVKRYGWGSTVAGLYAFVCTPIQRSPMLPRLTPLIAVVVIACSGGSPNPGDLRNITVESAGQCCGRSTVIGLSPSDTFRFVDISTGEFISGSLNYANFALALTQTSFFRRTKDKAWITLGSAHRSSLMSITTYECIPPCTYGTPARLLRISFDPALAPDLAKYVRAIYAVAEPVVLQQERALRQRLLRVSDLRSMGLSESDFLACRNLRATADRSDRLTGTIEDSEGRTISFAAPFRFDRLAALLRRSEPEKFEREYARSAQRGLELILHYKGFVYSAVAPGASFRPVCAGSLYARAQRRGACGIQPPSALGLRAFLVHSIDLASDSRIK